MGSRLINEYFEWICCMMGCSSHGDGLPYRRLLRQLHDTDFSYCIPMDGNRAEDGIGLRYRFGDERGYKPPVISAYLDCRPCSILEMMAALAIRCEEHIMDNPDIGDRTGEWFFAMVGSLGLSGMTDGCFEQEYVGRTLGRFLDRQYRKDGKGGLFTVRRKRADMRTVEIWYQAMWYLDEVLKG